MTTPKTGPELLPWQKIERRFKKVDPKDWDQIESQELMRDIAVLLAEVNRLSAALPAFDAVVKALELFMVAVSKGERGATFKAQEAGRAALALAKGRGK